MLTLKDTNKVCQIWITDDLQVKISNEAAVYFYKKIMHIIMSLRCHVDDARYDDFDKVVDVLIFVYVLPPLFFSRFDFPFSCRFLILS